MQQGNSVVGLRREPFIDHDQEENSDFPTLRPLSGAGEQDSMFYSANELGGESAVSPSPWISAVKILLLCAVAGWVGFAFYLFAMRGFAMPALEQVPAIATSLATPLVLLGLVYLILSRTSIGEANRFARITARLRKEADTLDARLGFINLQLDTARQTMHDQAALLEQYGGSASANLESAAMTLSQHASTSAQQAELIERAGVALTQQFSQLIDVMPDVEERANKISSSLADGSDALTERVDRLEARLESLGRLLDEARTRTTNATQSLTAQLMKIQDTTRSATEEISGMAELSTNRVDATLEQAHKALQETGSTLDTQMAGLTSLIEQSRRAIDEIGNEAVTGYGERISGIETRFQDLDRLVMDKTALIAGAGIDIAAQIDNLSSQFNHLDTVTAAGAEKIARTLHDLASQAEKLDDSLQSGNRKAEEMIARTESLLIALDASVRELDEGHPAALARLNAKVESSFRLLGEIMPEITQLESVSAAMLGQARESEQLLTGQGRKLKTWLDSGEASIAACREQIIELQKAMETADVGARRLADSAGPQLVATLLRVKETADQAGDRARQALARAIADATDNLGDASEQALADRLGQQFQTRIEEISTIADKAVQTAHAASDRLMRQLITIADTTASIEQRFAEAESAMQKNDQDHFSRQSAALIEALNSAAVDVTRILSQDIGDAAWAEYLKGDRGVFTRQAIRLIAAKEVGIVLELYGQDEHFRETVNRYIHDFEAMLRNVLAMGDGTSMAVTLLSSDIGKLYVALAQAIDRLKNKE